MSFWIDENTRLIVQGITGREGTFHAEQMQQYHTNVVAGVTPGRGGSDVLGVPVYNTVLEAKERHDANASVLFVPPRFLYGAAEEAILSGVPLVLTIAEGTPVHDMLKLHHLARERGVRLVGPNSFGVISPGKAKAGFMAHRIFSQGNVGVMSRSATNCYETVFLMKKDGFGQSTVVGVGGDMIPGSTFTDVLPFFERDTQTEVIVMIGEIGGSEEELAGQYIKEHVTKPVIALIAGKNAPKDTSMGHAGAIVSPDGEGSAESKEGILREAGCRIAESTEDIVRILKELRG
ncbi:MAG TPA: succinate--CoA ligase subunit alpha [Alkalispirochaeta sp.]|nr:succinate--CoA ligase subunit alpha [Alkalispirochaeta sp.]